MNGNCLRTLYSKDLKKFLDSKKVQLRSITPASRNGLYSLKVILLVCLELIWLCKHRIWCYNFWFRKSVKIIWSLMIFSGMFSDITWNVWCHSEECLAIFPTNFQKYLGRFLDDIPGNITLPPLPALLSPFLYSWFYIYIFFFYQTRRWILFLPAIDRCPAP